MKKIFALLILVSLVTGLFAEPAATNPPAGPAKAVLPATKVATNLATVPPLTNPAIAPANAATLPVLTNATGAPEAEAGAPLVRPIRTGAVGADTNAPAAPAFPAFPVPPPSRRAPPVVNTAPAGNTVPPGNVATPGGTPAPGLTEAPGVAGKPATTVISPGLIAPNPAAAKAGEEEMFPPGMIKFQDSDLLQVLDIYQDLTGRTVVRPNSLPAAKISVRSQTPLSRREAIQLLDTILAMNQITMLLQGEKFVKAVPQGSAPQEGSKFADEDAELDETTHYVTKVVQLKNAIPRDVTAALQPFSKMPNSIMAIDSSGILVLRDYEENVKRMEELLEKIDVVPMNEFEPIVIPIKYALAGDIAQVLSSLTAGGGGATTVGSHPAGTGLTSQGGLRGGGGGAGGLGGIGGQNSLPGQQGYGNNAGGLGGLGGAGQSGFGSPGATRSSFQDRLRNIVNRAASGSGDIVVIGNTKIIADERTNSLLVFATKGDVETITNIIAKLDVVLAQVIIEAIIMEVSLDDSLRYGFSYVQKQPQGNSYFSGIGGINNGTILNQNSFTTIASNGVAALSPGFSYAARFGNDFEATATAIATDNRINVLSRPRIQTSHAVEANLFVGETRPYITGTYSYFGGGGPSSQYSQLQIGITLSVLPLINADGLVVMDIRQKIQSIGGTTKIDNNEIPITVDREANAKVAVQDGQTVILGGFISTDRTKAASGVPLLKDIPLLGPLFRSTSKEMHRKELMVLIRPTVLPTPQIAATVAKQMKGSLPGISAAERDNARLERRQEKRLRAEDASEQKKLEDEELKERKKLFNEQQKLQKNLDRNKKREGVEN